ncbi:autotransporter outer membrane beta-barrel domain-containing protein [Thermochromatium tepidum]|uniref:Autotransporter domain-containing protein n=1 Tax=Thermochromatium tepidum ATCC 43061 TaxID=316276 RepID=A0A6I6E1C4_THETI|nr:autotransporter outer membrane beta-barrel domain-containing protein [Thermochromatium tepidum]QGU33674.1 autotransporter domain-containing protein [Thermochromatium tepidum ATCC 43061]
MIKKRQAAISAAILGLACYGDSSDLAAEESWVGSVVNTAVPQASPASDPGSVLASGATLEQVSSETGNTNTVGVGKTVFDACRSGANVGTQFQEDCTLLVVGGTEDASGTARTLTTLTPDQILAPRTASVEQVKAGIGVVSLRMENLRLAGQTAGPPFQRLNASNPLLGATGGGASGDLQIGRGGAFFNFKYLDAEQNRNRYTSGYDQDGVRFTLGADYRFKEDLILGVFGNYASGGTDYWRNKGDMDTSTWGLGLYGTRYWDNGAFVEGVLGYDVSDYDLTRRIDYDIQVGGVLTQVRQRATSTPEAGTFYTTLGGGYNLETGAFNFTPALSLNYLRTEIDSYRERMSDPTAPGGSLAIAYDRQTYTSFSSRLGFMVSKAFSSSVGVWVPQLSLDWVHEFVGDQDRIDARFVNDLSATPLMISTTNPDRNYFDLGIGISGQFAEGRSAFLAINKLLGYEDVESYTISGGIRLEF